MSERERVRVGLAVVALFVAGTTFLVALWSLQGDASERPTFECRPGDTYTTKECP